MSDPKVPAAVVYLERPDGRVLALTRGQDFADWHLPGGKWEPTDGAVTTDTSAPSVANIILYNLVTTAIREVQEETGLWLACANLRAIHTYTTTHNPERPGSGGRPVVVFLAEDCTWWPENFNRYPAGQPAWVPPAMLLAPSCLLRAEAAIAMEAVVRDRQARRGFVAEDLVLP
jgi:8-oxo-dGTP pyrophosphatase MutT (NUDIX family)